MSKKRDLVKTEIESDSDTEKPKNEFTKDESFQKKNKISLDVSYAPHSSTKIDSAKKENDIDSRTSLNSSSGDINTSSKKKKKADTNPNTPRESTSEVPKNMNFDGKSSKDSDKTIDDVDFDYFAENPLPDVFKYKKLGFYPDFISFSEDERKIFERHWIAYGGSVIKNIKHMDVDYVVHNESEIEFKKMLKLKRKLIGDMRHVTKNWLIGCINNVELVNTVPYAVTLLP